MAASGRNVFRVAALVAMLALMACKWTEDDVAETSDPAQLERIYRESEDADVKSAALAKIDDPAFLFALAQGKIRGAPVGDVMAALSRLPSQQAIEFLRKNRTPTQFQLQALLPRMMESDVMQAIDLLNDKESAGLALSHLTQTNSLIWIYENSKTYQGIRFRAFERITDQKYLADYAINWKQNGISPETDAHVLATLTDQAQLARVVLEADNNKHPKGPFRKLTSALLAKLTDQQALAELAVSSRRFGREAAAQVTDQKMLARIVRTVESESLIAMVLLRVEDPEVLLEVMAKSSRNGKTSEDLFYALKHPDQEVLLEKWGPWLYPEVVAKLTDAALLAEIALQSSRSEVRIQAVNNPNTSDDVVATAARTDDFLGVRQFAIYRANDPKLYEYVAVNDASEDMRLKAAEQLTNQASLIRVFQQQGYVADTDLSRELKAAKFLNKKVRLLVLAKITDQSILKSVVEDSNWDAEFRLTAAPSIRDQVLMKGLAANPLTIDRQIGAAGITDEAFLLDMFNTEPSDVVRATIINRLETPASLRRIALGAFARTDRNFAARRLRDNPDSDTTDIETSIQDLNNRADALRQNGDTAQLVPLALAAHFDIIMVAAAQGLSDPRALETVAMQGTNRAVLSVVLDRL